MEFGRVDGFVIISAEGQRKVLVVLDTGREMEVIRDEMLFDAPGNRDAARLADQLVAEALANELAFDGWEVVGEADTTSEVHRMLNVVARSPTWVVRRH